MTLRMARALLAVEEVEAAVLFHASREERRVPLRKGKRRSKTTALKKARRALRARREKRARILPLAPDVKIKVEAWFPLQDTPSHPIAIAIAIADAS